MIMKKNKRVVCVDGFTMSVQADDFTYCAPRNNEGPYTAVEVGFPSEYEELIIDWAEDDSSPTETVYGYVPIHIVSLVLAKHGGMVEGELPQGIPEIRPTDEKNT
jgi:hypothetical protein